jgi:DNA-binding transcriptional LysR family regulator
MPNMTLDMRNLRCVIAAAETGSFRQAAELLDLPQSSVSRRIQALEHRLRFALFERSRFGVKLTRAGAAFVEAAVAGADQLDFAVRYASAIYRGYDGGIRIGISPARTGGPLHEVLRIFKARFSHIAVSLTEGTALEVRRAVASGTLDLAFVIGAADMPGCRTQELWREAAYVVLPPTHPLCARREIDWPEIGGDTFVISLRGGGVDIEHCLIERLTEAGQTPRIDVHDVSQASILDLVLMGYGVAVAHGTGLEEKTEGVVFRPVTGSVGALQASALWLEKNANPLVRDLIRIAEAIGRGEVPAPFPQNRSQDFASQDYAAVPDWTDRRDRANSRSVPMKRSSIGAMRRVGSDTG